MRVISQDRTISVELDNVALQRYEGDIYTTTEGILGTYATEERAKEVFEEIHEAYANEFRDTSMRTIYEMPGENKC